MAELVIPQPVLGLHDWDISLYSLHLAAIRYVTRVNRRVHPSPRGKDRLTRKNHSTA